MKRYFTEFEFNESQIGNRIDYPEELDFILDIAKQHGFKQVTLYEAVKSLENKSKCYCLMNSKIVEKSECKKHICDLYLSRDACRNCMHKTIILDFGKKVTFKIK